ncbi:MAG: glutathione S-transferase N-terminal domain-containing protein [Thermoleophilaceae bacterium]
MKLYVCWGTIGGGAHACARAHQALREAGHEPEVVKARGWGALPDAFNGGRKEVIELTGQKHVPVLVTDGGEAVHPSEEIVEWARAHPTA